MRIEPGQIWSDRLPAGRVQVLWTNDTGNVSVPLPEERFVLYMWLDSPEFVPVLRSKRCFIEAFEPLVGGEHC